MTMKPLLIARSTASTAPWPPLPKPHDGPGAPRAGPRPSQFSVGNYVLFYRPMPDGIDLIRVLSGYLDIQPEDMS